MTFTLPSNFQNFPDFGSIIGQPQKKQPQQPYQPPPGSIIAGGPGSSAPIGSYGGASDPGLHAPTSGGSSGGNPAAAPGNPVNDVATAQANSSARAIIDGFLGQYGLTSLSSWAWSKYLANESVDQILLELRQTPEYKTRFPAMEHLAQSGHAISESQYINYEQGASEIFKANGLPSTFYDQPADFASFLTNDIALPELQNRVQMYRDAAYNTPPEVRQQLQAMYGVTPGELTAFFIDPDKALPLITQRYNAAQAGGYALTSGYGTINQTEAERIAQFGLSAGQTQAGFGHLVGMQEFFNPLIGTADQGLNRQQGLNAEFGQDAQAQLAIENERANRLATFKGGGGFAETAKGVVGAGSANY